MSNHKASRFSTIGPILIVEDGIADRTFRYFLEIQSWDRHTSSFRPSGIMDSAFAHCTHIQFKTPSGFSVTMSKAKLMQAIVLATLSKEKSSERIFCYIPFSDTQFYV